MAAGAVFHCRRYSESDWYEAPIVQSPTFGLVVSLNYDGDVLLIVGPGDMQAGPSNGSVWFMSGTKSVQVLVCRGAKAVAHTLWIQLA